MEKGTKLKFTKLVDEYLADDGFPPVILAYVGDGATYFSEGSTDKTIIIIPDEGPRGGQKIWVYQDEVIQIT